MESCYAAVARSTFGSQNVQNTPFSDHFWKLRCRRECAPLWCEAHFKVKSAKQLRGKGAPLVVQMSFCVAGASKKLCTLPKAGIRREGFVAVSTTTTTTLHSTPLQLQLQLQLQPQLKLQLHYITLHYTTLRIFHYITLHYTNYTTLHSTPLHSTTQTTTTATTRTTTSAALHHTTSSSCG